MARFFCKCGEALSNGLVPNDVVLHQFSDRQMDEIFRNDTILTSELHGLAKEIWECGKCGRLYSFNDKGQVEKTYILEL